ncbi:hypothetical protein LTS01_026106, partial [Friedmanniomyces endolithicus]
MATATEQLAEELTAVTLDSSKGEEATGTTSTQDTGAEVVFKGRKATATATPMMASTQPTTAMKPDNRGLSLPMRPKAMPGSTR